MLKLNAIKNYIFKYFENLIKRKPLFKKPVLMFYHAYLIHRSKQFNYYFYRKRNRLYIPSKYLLIIHFILVGQKKNYYPNNRFYQITKKKGSNPILCLERNLDSSLVLDANSINTAPFSAYHRNTTAEKCGRKIIEDNFCLSNELSANVNIPFIDSIYYTSQLNVNIHIKSYDCSTTIKSIAFFQKEISTKSYHLLSNVFISNQVTSLIFLKLNNPYMPIYLKAFSHNHDEQSYCIPFPSLARNGIHYPECQVAIKSSYMDTFFFLQKEYYDKFKSLDKAPTAIKVCDESQRYSDVIFSPLFKSWLENAFNIDIVKNESKPNLKANQLPAICALLDKKTFSNSITRNQKLIISSEQQRKAITIQYNPSNKNSSNNFPVVIHNMKKNHENNAKKIMLTSNTSIYNSTTLSDTPITVILFSPNESTKKKQQYLLQQQKGICVRYIHVLTSKNDKTNILKINDILKISKCPVLFIDEKVEIFNPLTIISLKHNLMKKNILSISPLQIKESNKNYSKKLNLVYYFYVYNILADHELTLIQPKENNITLTQSNTPVLPSSLTFTLVNPKIWNTLGGLVKNLNDLNAAFFHLALRAINDDCYCLINRHYCVGISSYQKKTEKPPINPLTFSQSNIDKIKKNLMGIKDIA